MSDIETIGWTAGKKFFVVKLNCAEPYWVDGEVVNGFASWFCQKYSGDVSGCQFVARFALVVRDKVFVSQCALDKEDGCVDDPFEKITYQEFMEMTL